jgi:phage baseplate assembly protein W
MLFDQNPGRDQLGVLAPFRRDKKRDFASGTGADLLRTKVTQALMTEGTTPRSAGELPWRTELGSGLTLLRHQRNDAAIKELARVYVRDALRRWVPQAELVSVETTSSDNLIEVRVRVREGAYETDVDVTVAP